MLSREPARSPSVTACMMQGWVLGLLIHQQAQTQASVVVRARQVALRHRLHEEGLGFRVARQSGSGRRSSRPKPRPMLSREPARSPSVTACMRKG